MAKRKRSILLLAYFLFRAKRWKEARSTLFEGFSQGLFVPTVVFEHFFCLYKLRHEGFERRLLP